MDWARRVYYDGFHVDVDTRAEWVAAPDVGVQVVVEIDPAAPRRWTCDGVPVLGRRLWTGDDGYDPWNWGVKYGTEIPWADYMAAWRAACGDH